MHVDPLFSGRNLIFSGNPKHLHWLPPHFSFPVLTLQPLRTNSTHFPTLLGLAFASLLHPHLPPTSLPVTPGCKILYSISGLGSLSGPKFFPSSSMTLKKKECSFIIFYSLSFSFRLLLDDIFFSHAALKLKCLFHTCPWRCGISPEVVEI